MQTFFKERYNFGRKYKIGKEKKRVPCMNDERWIEMSEKGGRGKTEKYGSFKIISEEILMVGWKLE